MTEILTAWSTVLDPDADTVEQAQAAVAVLVHLANHGEVDDGVNRREMIASECQRILHDFIDEHAS